MKCICGYEHKSGIDRQGEWQNYLKGDEEFIQLEGSIFRIENIKYLGTAVDVVLMACPKCKTVQMVD